MIDTILALPFLVLAATYTVLLAYAWLAADRIIFQPRPPGYGELQGFPMLRMPDGAGIRTCHFPNPAARHTIYYLHGNAEDLGGTEPFLREIHDAGFGVFSFDYRGYGLSEGMATESNVLADAEECWRHLTRDLGVDPNRVILYGRSVGSGPAVDLAARHQPAGLILDGAFVSAFRVVTRIPLLPFDRFRNLGKMKRVRCPVLVIHGRRDHTIPFSHGRRLWKEAPGPKRTLWVDEADHNDLIEIAGDQYWKAITDFAAKLNAPG